MDKNKLEKYSLLFNSIFIEKEKIINYYLNIFYWFIKTFKDIFKWIYAISLLKKNKTLFILLFLPPFFKFIFISLTSLNRFKRNFHRLLYLMSFMVILLLIESFCELPIHIIFPLNKIYVHTNYYRIYDLRECISFNINIEIIENFILLLYSINYFTAGKFHYSAVIILILSFFSFCFFVYAKVFYCLLKTTIRKEKSNNEVFTLKNSKEYKNSEDNKNKDSIRFIKSTENFLTDKINDDNKIPIKYCIEAKSKIKIQLEDSKDSSSYLDRSSETNKKKNKI